MTTSSAQPGSKPKVWLQSIHLIGAALVLAAIVIVLGLAFIQFERREARSTSQQQMLQLSKLMARQTDTDLEQVESMLLLLASQGSRLIDIEQDGHLQALVASIARGLPQLRSVSVLNEAGQVLGSTTPANLKAVVDPSLLGALPQEAFKVVLGPLRFGRDLGGLQRDLSAGAPAVLPMLVRLEGPSVKGLILLALVNAEHFSTFYTASANDRSVRLALAGYRGELLLATPNTRLALGSPLQALPVFTDFLPTKEWGSYSGPGLDGERVIAGFVTLSRWPLVMLVETSYSDVLAGMAGLERWAWVAMLASLAMIAVITLAMFISLRRHEAISEQLHGEVYASEARNRAVLASAVDAVISMDARGVILSFNPAAERIFGYSSRECIGQSLEQMLLPPGMHQMHAQAMARFAQSGGGPVSQRLNRRIETQAMRRGGQVFPVEMWIVSSQLDGEVFFTTTVRDITQEKAAAAELDATLNHYRELAQALELQKRGFDEHAIVSVADASEQIVYANDKLIETLGYSRQELIGRHYHEFRQRMPQSDYDALRTCLAQGSVWHGELAMRRRDGSNCWLSSTIVPIRDEQDEVNRFIMVQTDISELRQAEMELAQAHDRELQIGTRIQQSLLGAYGMNDLAGLWLSTFNRASRGIDGDFVDVIRIGEHCLDIVAGDVMGKGVPAALLGAATKLQFSRSLAEMLVSGGYRDAAPAPADIVAAVHRVMTPHLQALEAFVTLVYVRVDSLRGVISWVGCGHEETLVVRQGGVTELLSNQHPPMGVLEEKVFMQDELPLKAGDAVFLCSDGLADATLIDGERVGHDRVNQSVVQATRDHASPAAALHSLRRDVLHEGVQLNDDVTMVMLMCSASQTPACRCELPVSMSSLRPLREFVTEQSQRSGLAEARVDLLTLASVEVFTNIVRHGKGLLPDAPVECIVRWDQADLVLELVHPGDAFTPKEPAEIDLDSYPEGGFGLTIIRSACDRLEYLHHAGVNTVRMTLHLEA